MRADKLQRAGRCWLPASGLLLLLAPLLDCSPAASVGGVGAPCLAQGECRDSEGDCCLNSNGTTTCQVNTHGCAGSVWVCTADDTSCPDSTTSCCPTANGVMGCLPLGTCPGADAGRDGASSGVDGGQDGASRFSCPLGEAVGGGGACACAQDSDCAPGQACPALGGLSYCALTTPTSCQSASDCPSSVACISGFCLAPAAESSTPCGTSECPPGQVCDTSNLCISPVHCQDSQGGSLNCTGGTGCYEFIHSCGACSATTGASGVCSGASTCPAGLSPVQVIDSTATLCVVTAQPCSATQPCSAPNTTCALVLTDPRICFDVDSGAPDAADANAPSMDSSVDSTVADGTVEDVSVADAAAMPEASMDSPATEDGEVDDSGAADAPVDSPADAPADAGVAEAATDAASAADASSDASDAAACGAPDEPCCTKDKCGASLVCNAQYVCEPPAQGLAVGWQCTDETDCTGDAGAGEKWACCAAVDGGAACTLDTTGYTACAHSAPLCAGPYDNFQYTGSNYCYSVTSGVDYNGCEATDASAPRYDGSVPLYSCH